MWLTVCRSWALCCLRAMNFKRVLSSEDFAGRHEFALPMLQGRPQSHRLRVPKLAAGKKTVCEALCHVRALYCSYLTTK